MRDIDKIVKDVLIHKGFVYKKSSWYRISDDLIQIINFQKSQFSNKYYLNIGIDEKEGQDYTFKAEYLFPIRLRVNMILSDKQLIDALDFEKAYSEISRKEKLDNLIIKSINFLDSVSKWEQLKSAMNSNSHLIHHAFITKSFIEKINS
ncbi:MAG: DUF4304 domain-containing protein [Bacteroidales bacterium]|nr:DUF4304 domain-containing protein [Bacteroidales bacterium]